MAWESDALVKVKVKGDLDLNTDKAEKQVEKLDSELQQSADKIGKSLQKGVSSGNKAIKEGIQSSGRCV